MKKARSFLAIAVVGLALLSVAGTKAYAATPPAGQGNGLKIAPVRTDLTIDKGGSRTVSLFVENITAFPMTVQGVVNDFVASDDESGEPRVILDDKQSAPGNSFKSLISTLPSATLKPNERREMRVTLAVPKNATSGGYYGAIRFAPSSGQTDKNVALTASVGTIFLIRVPGNITEQLKVESFDVTKNGGVNVLFNSGPVSVVTRFKNFGNIHVLPFGKITVKDFKGHVIQETEVNNTQPRGSVLPGSIRKFDTPIKEKKLFGRYTVEGSFGYGSNGDLILAKKTFYVIPFKMIAAVLLGLAFLIFILPRLIRAYNRRIIQKAGGQPASAAKPKARANPRSKPPARKK
jgi:hypothetical protein